MKDIYKRAAISKGRFLKKAAKKLKITNKSYTLLNVYDKERKDYFPKRFHSYTKDAQERYRLTSLLLNVSDFKLGIKYRTLQLYSRGKPFIKHLPWTVSRPFK